jgi:hypothetical protein
MKYEYIIDSRGFYVVPWASTPKIKNERDSHFSKKFGVRPLIVSPDMWDILLCSYKLQIFKPEEK